MEHHNKSIIKNKGWSPFDLTTIILLYFLLPVWSNYIEIPYECESVKVVKSKGISM